ncbi:peptidase S8/S53 domain-containing protein [Stachybotrys elegans]|uniref:Peptidase S8/S53 domain-containing protein n=1 Tax=Stachybotrys elegans TaxID=80388 RepID=A0A8K0WW19_9HYPO|nr:peptidase S8/S53 domain-containing protein [Stachybotrys elegans]
MVRSTLALSLLATASAALGANSPLTENTGPKQVPGAYIVEFEDGISPSQFRTQAEPEYETRMTFDYELFKGASIQLKDTETAEERAAQLASLPAVKNIWPVRMYDRPNPIRGGETGEAGRPLFKRQLGGNETTPYPPHIMTGVDKLHAEGITGKGVTIAVIDTGIDYHHPSLGGCFGEGCLVAYGYDLVGDDYDGTNTYPDDDPDDCSGHGTHVAGIIAAQGENPEGFSGAAPGVTLAAYRVFGCGRGGTSSDILIAAFNMAYEQGADIITGSVLDASGWPQDPWSVAVSRIVEKGVPCTLAAGNYGGVGLFFSSAAADGKGVTAVASFDNPLVISLWLRASYSVDDGESVDVAWGRSWPEGFDNVEREVWASSLDITNPIDACQPLPDDTPDLGDYYVLFRLSRECNIEDQTTNLAAKGARFIVRYNDDDRIYSFSAGYSEGDQNILGAAAIGAKEGEAIVKALEAGSVVKATFAHPNSADKLFFRDWDTVNPGAVSGFTSWGPTYEMDFKPQFGAPGGDVFSTYPVELGMYDVLSGTSMATPFVAAAYALVSEARGGAVLEPAVLESLFASTAKPQLWSGGGSSPFEDWLAPGAQQGAGLIQVYDAAYATARLEPSGLSFNDTVNSGPMNFTIVNEGSEDVVFEISHVPTRTLYTLTEDELTAEVGFPESVPQTAELSFSETKVTVGAGSTVTIEVVATAPEGLNEKRYPYWSGYIAVNGTDSSALSIPYQGISGSLYEANVVPEAWLAVSGRDGQFPAPPNMTFVLPGPGGDQPDVTPAIVFNLAWGTKYTALHLVPASTSPLNSTVTTQWGFESIGKIWEHELVVRAGFTSPWRGGLGDGTYPPAGSYKLAFVVQRMFSDGSREEDWIVRYSVPFSFAYPSA